MKEEEFLTYKTEGYSRVPDYKRSGKIDMAAFDGELFSLLSAVTGDKTEWACVTVGRIYRRQNIMES